MPQFGRVGRMMNLGGIFDYRDVPGLVALYKRGVGITLNGSNVSQWGDQSGNGRHLKQATATNQPSFESDNTILFDGVDNFMAADDFTLVQPETVFILCKLVSKPSGFDGRIFDGTAVNAGSLHLLDGTSTLRVSAGTALDSLVWSVGSYAVLTTILDDTGEMQVDNGTPTTGDVGAADMSGFTLGDWGQADGTRAANIQVKEVVIYSVAHGAAQRKLVIDHMLTIT